MMTRRHPRNAAGSLPVLTASFAPVAAAEGESTPSARAVARLFPLGEGGERILLAVAEGIADPLSAEAQAAEALGRIEAVVARAAADALPEDLLDAGFQAAAEGVRRLAALPGGVPDAGVALAAAIIEDGTVAVASAGHGAVFLQRDGATWRLTEAQADDAGAQIVGGAEQAVALTERLQPGDALLVASERVARGLGERVIEAVFEEYGPDGAADELARLAADLPEAQGAAVALLHLPAASALPVAAAGSGAGAQAAPRPGWLAPLAVLGAIILGVVVVSAIAFAASRGGGNKAAATRPATQVAVLQTPIPTPPPVTPLAATAASATPGSTPAATATPGASPTPGASATPNASATPSSLANLPACSGGADSKPCSYTAQPGDSLSVIGDRFDITRACFESANLRHDPVPPRAPDFRIGAGETYVIPDAATCATLPPAPAPPPAAATATPAAATRPAATRTAGPAASPAAGNPTRAPSAATAGPATAAPAAASPAPSVSASTRRGPCTPVPGEQFPRPTC